MIPQGWRSARLGELVSIVTGATPKAAEIDSWGTYLDFVTPSDQFEGYREAVPARRLSKLGADRLKKRIVPPLSTNLTCIGSTIGKVSMSASECVTNQQINSLVAREQVADPRFIYYMILGWSSELKRFAAGSATPIVNKSDLSDFKFSVPPLSVQHAIAEVLGALDDKIAANRKLVSGADALSRAHFLEIAQEAERTPLSATANFINGKAFTKGASGTGRVVIRIAELNSGLGSSTVRSDLDVEDQYTARPGDILFAWSGSLTLHRWFRDEAIVNQHIFKVVPNEGIPPWLVYQLVAHKLPYFKNVAADKATTMGHIQRKHLDELVPIPSARQIEEKSELMSALWGRALLAEQESEKLIGLRDTLLPRLMSGELRVRDAEDLVSNAV